MERTYYTLDDIRKALGGNYAQGEGPYSMFDKSFASFLNGCLGKASLALRTGTNETNEAITCFTEYIWPRFYQEFVVYVDSDENDDLVQKFAKTKVGQILA